MDNKITGEQEDRIYEVKKFIQELGKVQDDYLLNLCQSLNYENESKLSEWLFDYVFNDKTEDSFGEYLDRGNYEPEV